MCYIPRRGAEIGRFLAVVNAGGWLSFCVRLTAVCAAWRAAASAAVLRAAAGADPLHECALRRVQRNRARRSVNLQVLQVSRADERSELLKGFAGGENRPQLVKGQAFFGNWYVAATKHFMVGGNEIAGTLAYRYYLKEWNKKH